MQRSLQYSLQRSLQYSLQRSLQYSLQRSLQYSLQRSLQYLARCAPAALPVLVVAPLPSHAQLQLFHDRTAFTAAMTGLPGPITDDFESYALGDIPLGGRRK